MFNFNIRTGNTSRSGFTLIELLVVIAIIGILASVVLASLSSARLKSRDAKRASDMKELQKAMELFASDHGGLYPLPPSTTVVSDLTSGESDITPYITIPTDPTRTGNNGYRYNAPSDRRSYTLLVNLEGDADDGISWCEVGTLPGVWNYPNCDFR